MEPRKRFLISFLLVASAFNVYSQGGDPAVKEGGEIPPRTYIKQLLKEADAALKVRVKGVHLDSCTTCTSTGALYIVECDVLKKYFDKRKRIEEGHLYYASGADAVSARSKDMIVFLNRIESRDVGKFRSIRWTAREATEFIYTPETESFIVAK